MAELPPSERPRFEQLFRATLSAAHSAGAIAKAPASGPDFGQRLRRIYGEKIASDSHGIIDEGRGDR